MTCSRTRIARPSAKQKSGELQRNTRYLVEEPHSRPEGCAMELEARESNIQTMRYQDTGEAVDGTEFVGVSSSGNNQLVISYHNLERLPY